MTFLKKIKSVLATLGKSGIERRMTESKSLSYKCSILFSVLYKILRALVRVSDRHAQVVKSRIYDVGWFHVKSSKSENPQKMEFALFWCKGRPWGVIQESRIFFRSDQYFGFYGGLKF